MKKDVDDFEWARYTEDYYAPQVAEMHARGEFNVIDDTTTMAEGRIIWGKGVHFHIKNLCECIHGLRPQSVFECGCADGHHLHTIKNLFPNIEVAGCELLQSQRDVVSEILHTPKEITDKIIIADFTEDLDDRFATYDFVYTNAVVMHLSYEKAVAFVNNMQKIATRWIRLAEDLGQHDFMQIFQTNGMHEKFIVRHIPSQYCILLERKA